MKVKRYNISDLYSIKVYYTSLHDKIYAFLS